MWFPTSTGAGAETSASAASAPRPGFPTPPGEAYDELSSDLQDAVRENWGSVCTHVAQGPVQTRFNHRLTSLDTRDLHAPLRVLFDKQATAFKINYSFGFILKEKQSGRLRYYHLSNNCCVRLLEEPSLITNRADFDRFLARIREPDILQWAIPQRPNSHWVCEHVTNATFFVNQIVHHPIGCVGIDLPNYVKNNKAIVRLDKDSHRKAIYNDNLCLFRCLALHLKREVDALYVEYTDTPVPHFAGVTLDELDKVETTFKTNVFVYKLVEIANGKTTAELVRRSMGRYPDTMNVNLHETHYSYIRDMQMCSHSYRCQRCDSLWKQSWELRRHELGCEGKIIRVYPGGVFHTTPSIFERLDDEGICVTDDLRFYPYRATFDCESSFDGENMPTNTDRVQWITRHVPLSVSIASNVPGHEAPCCFITNGDSDALVADMMTALVHTSDTAFDLLMPSYKRVFVELRKRKNEWNKATLYKSEDEKKNNPYEKHIQQLCSWLRQLPVIGFNSGRYDLNVVKKFFTPYMLKNDEIQFVIKRQNTFMCFSTEKLKLCDIVNYLAPGFSYDKYLKAYGCELQKGHFPYEYMDGVGKLDDRAIPPQAAFFSQLKNEGIADTDYARCQTVWHPNGMTTMRDYLIWYNNRDVTPFLEAISKQFVFYQKQNNDMFKDGISVPGLSLLYMFNDLPPNTFFTIFNQTNSDLHKLVKDNIVGGPAIILYRYHEKGITKIRRGSELCRKIVGYDANALYLWALTQDMPTGSYTSHRAENGFRPQRAQPYGQMAVQWLTRESERTGLSIRH